MLILVYLEFFREWKKYSCNIKIISNRNNVNFWELWGRSNLGSMFQVRQFKVAFWLSILAIWPHNFVRHLMPGIIEKNCVNETIFPFEFTLSRTKRFQIYSSKYLEISFHSAFSFLFLYFMSSLCSFWLSLSILSYVFWQNFQDQKDNLFLWL